MSPTDVSKNSATGRIRALTLWVVLAALGYLAVSVWSGWRGVVEAVLRVGVPGIAAALLLSLLNFAIRFVRWEMYLRALGERVPTGQSFRIYLAGFALTPTPGSAGEAVVRGAHLKSFGVDYSKTLAAYLAERITDVVAVCILVGLGLGAYVPAQPFVGYVLAGICLIVVVLWHEPLLRKLGERLHGFHGRAGRLALRGIDTMVHVRSCLTLPQFVTGLVLGCAAWAATGLAFFLLLRALGSEISLQVAVFIYALSILAGAVSFLPGGLGTAEATMFGLLIVSGMRSTEAVAATILIRTVTLWFAVSLGIWFLRSSSAERKI